MRRQHRLVPPFLDHEQYVRPHGRLGGDVGVYLHRAAVFEASLLGADQGLEPPERLEILLDKGASVRSFLHKPTDTEFMWHSALGLRPASETIGTRKGGRPAA